MDDRRTKVVIQIELDEDDYADLRKYAVADYDLTTSQAADYVVRNYLGLENMRAALKRKLTDNQYAAYHAEERALLVKYWAKKSKAKKA